MAARDNVLFYGSISSGAAAGTVIPLALLHGVENVRTGYGSAKLQNVRALYTGVYSDTASNLIGIPIELKNSNWIDSAGLIAQNAMGATLLDRDSLGFMRGRGKELNPNTAWTINAVLPSASTAAGFVYVLLEIEYSDVPGFDTDKQPGSPVLKKCENASITAAANVLTTIGSFDNLLSGTEYLLSEVSALVGGAANAPQFIVLEGFSNQRGLIRIFVAKTTGLADPIEGSVKLTKQTYSVGIISATAISAQAVTVRFEMIASKN